MSVKHINSLRRFDFTSDCKTCEYRKDLGALEYCCSFVYDYLQKQRLLDLKKHILDYVLIDDELDKVNPVNVFFTEDDVYCVNLSFKTNLRTEKQLIMSELKRALSKSPYFHNVQVNSINTNNKADKEELLDTFIGTYLKGDEL